MFTNRTTGIAVLSVLVCLLSTSGWAATWSATEGGDHQGADWIINADTEVGGRHINIGAFSVEAGQTATVKATRPFMVRANTIDIVGTIDAEGKGFPGGEGGEGSSREQIGGKEGNSGLYDSQIGGNLLGLRGEAGTASADNEHCGFNEWCCFWDGVCQAYCCDQWWQYDGNVCGGGGAGGGGGGGNGTVGCGGQTGFDGDGSTCIPGAGGLGGNGGEALLAGKWTMGAGGGGAGGGGAGYKGQAENGGPGGAGGGLVVLEALVSYSQTGLINVNGVAGQVGGNGGPAYDTNDWTCEDVACQTSYYAGGTGGAGGGGAGGTVVLSSPDITITGTDRILAKGGTGYDGSYSDGTGAGGAGRVEFYRDAGSFACTGGTDCVGIDGCNTGSPSVNLNNLVKTTLVVAHDTGINILPQTIFVESGDHSVTTVAGTDIAMIPGMEYFIFAPTWIRNGGYYYHFKEWRDDGGFITSQSAHLYSPSGNGTLRAVYETLEYWIFTNADGNNNWADKGNWLRIHINGTTTPAPNPPAANNNIVIPDGQSAILRQFGAAHPECKDLYVESGATVRIDQTVAINTNIAGSLVVDGTFIPSGESALDGSALFITLDFDILPTGAVNLTQFDTDIERNVTILSGAIVETDPADINTRFALIGGTNGIVRIDADSFKVNRFIVDKDLDNEGIQLASPVGPFGDGVDSQFIGAMSLETGLVDINGYSLVANYQLCALDTQHITMSRNPTTRIPSRLRSLGETGSFTKCSGVLDYPIYLNRNDMTKSVIDGYGAEINVGPYSGAGVAVGADEVGIWINNGSYVELKEGGYIGIDNLQDDSGWGLRVDSGGKLHVEQTSLEIDGNLEFYYPNRIESTEARFTCGIGMQAVGGGVYYFKGNLTYYADDTEVQVYGNHYSVASTRGSTTNDRLIMMIDGGWIKSNSSYDTLVVAGDTTIVTTAPDFGDLNEAVPAIYDRVIVNSSAELQLPPETLANGSLRVGHSSISGGGQYLVYGTLSTLGTELEPVLLTVADMASYYEILVFGGQINAEYTTFELMGPNGIYVDGTGQIGTDGGNYLFKNCRFKDSSQDVDDRSVHLQVDNAQDITVSDVRFITDVYSKSQRNIKKTVDQGSLIMENAECTPADVDCTVDLYGEENDADEFGRVFWELEPPEFSWIDTSDSPLNAGNGRATIRIRRKNAIPNVEYCIWDVGSGRFMESTPSGFQLESAACPYVIDQISECCNWFSYAELGGASGFDMIIQDGYWYEFKLANRVGTMPDDYREAEWSWWTGMSEDRTSPNAPGAVTVETVAGSPDMLRLSWDASSDVNEIGGNWCLWDDHCNDGWTCETFGLQKFCANASGDTCDDTTICPWPYDYCKSYGGQRYCARYLDYVIFRGHGNGNSLTNALPTDATPPTDYKPVLGDADSFEDDYDEGAWSRSISTPDGVWMKANGVLQGNCLDNTCRVSFNFSGAEYDFSHGYIMMVDARKIGPADSNGFEVIFPFGDGYARWSVGEEYIDPGQLYSRIHYHTEDWWWTYPEEFNPNTGDWYQLTIYVKGDVTRGFIDGVEMWELWWADVPGDPIANMGTTGFRLNDSNAQFDNFFIAPFVSDESGPLTQVLDPAAVDSDGPLPPVFADGNVVAASLGKMDLTLSKPPVEGNRADNLDRSSPYYYYVMAVDEDGNTSNLLQNQGFEGADISVWQRGASDPLVLNQAITLEGTNSGYVDFPIAQTEVGVQNVSITAPINSILRFERYALVELGTGSINPAVIEVTAPFSAVSAGEQWSSFADDWLKASTFYPPAGTLAQGVTALNLYAAPGGGSTFDLYLDQNRLDLITGASLSAGYQSTEVQMLAYEGGDVCDDNEFVQLGIYSHGAAATVTVSDQSGFGANRLRTYRMRSCDAAGNCGPWSGGVDCSADSYSCGGSPCTPDEYCQTQTRGGASFTGCGSFEGGEYCVRANGCLPGVERFSFANVPPAPNTSVLTEAEAAAAGVDWSSTVVISWDLAFATNRSGTKFLVAGWNSGTPGTCGDGAPAGYLASDGTLGAFDGAMWNSGRIRMVTGLETNQFYCFRVMAQNGDQIATGEVDAAPAWTGWSPLSGVAMPPAKPSMLAGSFSLLYGVQDVDSSSRAMVVDGTTKQELTFTVTDDNNLENTYNDIRQIWVRVSPHADFINAAAKQRGFFTAEYDYGSDTWTFGEESTGYGNDRVALQTGAGGSSIFWLGNALSVHFTWTLNRDGATVSYLTDQDQGIQIYIEDSQGHISDFMTNRFGACSDVFHSSYLPSPPSDRISPVDDAWTNAGKTGEPDTLDFWAEGNIDRDDQYQTSLYDLCTSLGVCNSWDLDDKADYFNCIDDSASIGDTVEYRISVHSDIDGEGNCTDASMLAPSADFWTATAILHDAGQDIDYYKLLKAIDLSGLPEGPYYWCAAARDQHHYAATGSGDTSQTIVTGGGSNKLGIDRTNPVVTGFNVVALLEGDVEDDITNDEGDWVFSTRVRIGWSASPYEVGQEAPIHAYRYILMLDKTADERIDPYAYAGGDPNVFIGEYAGGQPSYVVDMTNNELYAGRHQFGMQVRDRAGNISETTWYDLRLESPVVDGPCIVSDTHPDQYEIYCNLPQEQDGEIVWNEEVESAPKPEFQIIDPVRANFSAFDAEGSVCCTRTNPSGDCVHYMSGSGMQAYSFTISQSRTATPDAAPEDDNAGNCEAGDTVCEQRCAGEANCSDSDQCSCDSDSDCGGGDCVDSCYCCDGVNACNDPIMHYYFIPGSEGANNLYHEIRYFISKGFTQQSGTFYFSIKGWTVAGVETLTRRYRINVCGCSSEGSNEPCKDASNSARLRGDNMNYFGGGSLAFNADNGSEETVVVAPFYLDRTEVSVEAYQRCVDDGVCVENRSHVGGEDLPVVNVTWNMARTYCNWADKRLPNEAEWQFAAESQSNLADEPASTPQFEKQQLMPVSVETAPSAIIADHKVVNLLGNVSEWMEDWRRPESMDAMQIKSDGSHCQVLCKEDASMAKLTLDSCLTDCRQKVIRGSSFRHSEVDRMYREYYAPSERQPDLGFRCAKDADTGVNTFMKDRQLDNLVDVPHRLEQ